MGKVMILVVGGYKSGKKDYVKAFLNYKEEDFSCCLNDRRKVLYDLQSIAPSYSKEELLQQLVLKEVVICNEVGCGLVPISKEEREAREVVGRICIELAKKAEKVIRVTCGIGTIIKG